MKTRRYKIQVTISFDEDVIKWIDNFIESGNFKTRSEVIDHFMRLFITDDDKKAKKGNKNGD